MLAILLFVVSFLSEVFKNTEISTARNQFHENFREIDFTKKIVYCGQLSHTGLTGGLLQTSVNLLEKALGRTSFWQA